MHPTALPCRWSEKAIQNSSFEYLLFFDHSKKYFITFQGTKKWKFSTHQPFNKFAKKYKFNYMDHWCTFQIRCGRGEKFYSILLQNGILNALRIVRNGCKGWLNLFKLFFRMSVRSSTIPITLFELIQTTLKTVSLILKDNPSNNKTYKRYAIF